jgi:hypothetical protein
MAEKKEEGLRFNTGKIRYDLIHPVGQEGLARVLTKGAKKYAPKNWEKGMSWSDKLIPSMNRHFEAIKAGEDYDFDPNCEACQKGTPGGDINDWYCTNHTGELHADLLQTNAHFLSSYYKIYPEGDDRTHNYLATKRIGLDIDDVLAEWVKPFTELAEVPTPESWYFGFPSLVEKIRSKGVDYFEFMSNLPVKTKASDIPFEPVCYITNRSNPDVPVEIAEQWLIKNGYPQVPVIQTKDKVAAAKEMNLDIFVDDRFETFKQMTKAGILCYLFDAPHNRRYNVGHKRIKSLKDVPL